MRTFNEALDDSLKKVEDMSLVEFLELVYACDFKLRVIILREENPNRKCTGIEGRGKILKKHIERLRGKV